MIEGFIVMIIRKKVQEGHFDFTQHALVRIAERQIEIEKVLECILEGAVIEFQEDQKTQDIKVLFQERNDKRPEIYAVVAALETPLIITVCRTKKEVWDWIDDVLKRREVQRW